MKSKTKFEVDKDGFTVEKLLKFIEEQKIPKDALVFFERIKDVYFEKYGWTTLKKEGFEYWKCLEHNRKCQGEYLDKKRFPKITPENLYLFTEEELEKFKDEFIQPHSCAKFKDDNNLYIVAHY